MRVFYFTGSTFGLMDLESRHLKVSEFNNLNDPFELLGVEMSDVNVRKAMIFEKSQILKSKGLICFSDNKYDPVQWAHYAENHKGICLGFDIPDKFLREVNYVPLRLAKSTLSEPNKREKLLITKFKHWAYEQEQRLIIDLANRERVDNLIYEKFSSNMSLKEIYIGCKSSLEYTDIKKAFSSGKKEVIIKHTRPAFKEFKIVWDKSKKSERI